MPQRILPTVGRASRLAASLCWTLCLTAGANAQSAAPAAEEAPPKSSDLAASYYDETTVTVTGNEIDTFEVAQPVVVIESELIEERQPNNASDLLRDQPGVDINGVGPNQVRPIIRGQRGLRVLFLEDGLRMNNARRQTDFGEITGLVDVNNVQRMEVVRGPASVLYGSDAIGGVLNLITKAPAAQRLGADLDARYSSADEQQRLGLGLQGGSERVSFSLRASVRDAEDYDAPSGRFGDIELANDVRVIDSGIEDDSVAGRINFQAGDEHLFYGRFNRYRAEQAGFGLVEPELIDATDATRIRILYPFQDYDRYVLGWQGVDLDTLLLDTAELKLYSQANDRQLRNDIDIDIGPIFGPGPSSSVLADTLNFTQVETFGARTELTKATAERQLFTFGAEFFEDETNNTDFSTTTTILRAAFPLTFICGPAGARPPFECTSVATDDVPNAPNATNTAYGLFLQDEIYVTDRLGATLGIRYSNTETKARPTRGFETEGLDFEDDAVVGSIGLTYELRPSVNLVASYGTAFRAPNIIERLFNGPTPEGLGFQILNPDLKSEESESLDLGVKVRTARAFFEAFYFDSQIDDAIIQYTLSEADIAQLPLDLQQQILGSGVSFVVQQRNSDVLKIDGFELAGGYRFASGVELGGNFTKLDGESVTGGPAADPTGETFSEKASAYARYNPGSGRYWLEYRVRHNGEQDTLLDPNATIGPIGAVLPSFTVHDLGAGYRLYDGARTSHTLGLVLENLSDELYAEFSNASFFRPQPGRSATLSYRLRLR